LKEGENATQPQAKEVVSAIFVVKLIKIKQTKIGNTKNLKILILN
jgi:hypothetical protein